MDWIPAVPLSWGPGPVRPVTLRRHLSMALPLSKSRRVLCRQLRSSTLLCSMPFVPEPRRHAAGRKSIGYRIVIGCHVLRAEVDRRDAVHDLGGELRRIHVGRLQLRTSTRCRPARSSGAAPSARAASDPCAARGCRAGRAPPCSGRTRSGSLRRCAKRARRWPSGRSRCRRRPPIELVARPTWTPFSAPAVPPPPPPPPPALRLSAARLMPPLEPGALVVSIERCGRPARVVRVVDTRFQTDAVGRPAPP